MSQAVGFKRSGLLPQVAVAAGILLALAAPMLPSYYVGLLIEGLVFSIFAASLNLLLGYAGLPSLGHAAYFAAGAYAAGLTAVHVTTSFWVGALNALLLSSALAAVFGLLALRATGVYFLMITLALAQVVWAVAFSWRSVTGGDDGLRGVPRPTLGFVDVDLSQATNFYLFALAAFALAMIFIHLVFRSPFGRSLRGIQDNPIRMNALGYNVWLYKYLAFVLASALAGFAGALFVYYKGFVSPEVASIVVSAEVMLMVILGGAATVAGPAVGAFAIILMSNFISAYASHWTFILGALYVLVVLLAPSGLIGALNAKLGETRKLANDRPAG